MNETTRTEIRLKHADKIFINGRWIAPKKMAVSRSSRRTQRAVRGVQYAAVRPLGDRAPVKL